MRILNLRCKRQTILKILIDLHNGTQKDYSTEDQQQIKRNTFWNQTYENLISEGNDSKEILNSKEMNKDSGWGTPKKKNNNNKDSKHPHAHMYLHAKT